MTTTVVLEIGNIWLKVVVFKTALGAAHLRGVLAKDINGQDDNAIGRQIAEFLKGLNIKKPQNLVICFSRNSVTLRNLRIPSVNPSEIDDMIKLHVGRQVPYAKEEIVNGHSLIGRDAMGYSKIMLAIVHRENIRRIFRILEKAELYSDKIELSSEGVLSWLKGAVKMSEMKAEDACLILDVDSAYTDFIVASPAMILFSRVIASGAEQLKDPEKWPRFFGEMKQTMVISQGEEILQKPVRVYVVGAVGQLKGFISQVETEFNLPASVVQPLEGVQADKDIVKSPPEALDQTSFSSLFGLGLDLARKKINFVLPEAQIRRALRERTRDIVLFGSGMMYFILIVCGIYSEKLYNRKAYLKLLNERYKTIAVQADNLNEELERLKKIKSKLDTNTIVLNYLSGLSKILPPEILVVNLSFQKDERMVIKGQAAQMSDIFKFITTLEDSPYFKDVETRYTTRKKIKGKDINEFELICPLEGIQDSKAAKGAAAAKKAKGTAEKSEL
ncbi:MAG: PilN domain-containing protein [Candidatus Velamenicoccus archaeovorus]